MENEKRRNMIQPWEYWLGDKAYIGCPEFLTEFKKTKSSTRFAPSRWSGTCCCSTTVGATSASCGQSRAGAGR